MTPRAPRQSIVANPVLIGAATVLVVLVALFLSYNANSGLPFVPTYQVTALVRDAQQLGKDADVRIGGKRVGLVTSIRPEPRRGGPPVAALQLKLDQTIQPLPADTLVRVRPRSIIGLKYLQLTPGHSRKGIPAGGTIPLADSRPNVDLQDAFNAFDSATRRAVQQMSTDLGNGLAGRGSDLNQAVRAFGPLLTHLTPVADNLAAPQTDLSGFLRGLNSAASAVLPVAPQLIGLFDGAATTLDAIARRDAAYRQLLRDTPATERVATTTLRRVRPVLVAATRLTANLRPGVAVLPRASTRLARAFETGTPVLARADGLADRLGTTLSSLHTLVRDPATGGSVVELNKLLDSLVPTLQFLNPVQVRCNYLALYFRNAASVVSEGDANGNWFRFMPLQLTPDGTYQGNVSDGLHFDPYASTGQDGRCVPGNEGFEPGTQVGNNPPSAAHAPGFTQNTAPPAGVAAP